MKRKITPTVKVNKPLKRKIIFQGARVNPCQSLPVAIPYATRPPKI
jgi:hypothetical protein